MRLLPGVHASASAVSSRLRFPRVPFTRSSPASMVENGAASSAAASSSSSSAKAGDGGAAQKPWLFVGLGNPGRIYKGTRHNVGFEMIDALAEAEGISISNKHFKAMIYDDLDLPFAKLRLLPKGGHGGHNGMRSVIHHFKESRDFPRLRIGIGRPTGMMGAIGFVLRSFTEEEQKEVYYYYTAPLNSFFFLNYRAP
uniref:Uncharacterized protein n=1 Tax=Avena sativa TaxID=4498 RepID=A0ACD5TE73_AVESA